MRQLLLEIRRKIEFSAGPIAEIMCSIDIGKYRYINRFLDMVCTTLKEERGESFKDVWSSSLIVFNSSSGAFGPDETALLQAFGAGFGNGGVSQQLQLIDMTVEYFEQSEKKTHEKVEKQGKISMMLPIYAGIVICILII